MGYGIDIGAANLKIVQVRRTLNGFRIVGASRKRLPRVEKPEETKQNAIRGVREALGLREGQVAVVGLSGRDINLKTVQQAQMKPIQYRTMMGYEVDQARGSDNQLYGDFCTLREPDPYYPNYLAMVGLAKVAYVDDRLAIAQSAGLDVRDAVPTPFAIYTAYHNAYGDENGTVMLLDIGAETTDLVLVRGGRLIFCRNVSTGARVFDQNISSMAGLSSDDAEARKIQYGTLGAPAEGADPREEEIRPAIRTSAGQLAGVITSSITFAKGQLNDRELTVDKIYVSGGGARLKGLPEYLQSSTKIAVEVLDPFKNCEWGSIGDNPDAKQLPSDLVAALGLAQISTQSRGGSILSIIPDRLKVRRNFFRSAVFLIAAGVVLAVGVAAATGVAIMRRSAAAAELAKFQEETKAVSDRITQLDKLEEELRVLIAKRRLLDSHVAPGRGLLETVLKLRKTLPDGIHVRTVELVNLAEDRAATPGGPRRLVFSYPNRGILEGTVPRGKTESPNDPDVRVHLSDAAGHSEPEVFSKGAMIGAIPVDAPWLGVLVKGEIDDNIKGGPGTVLDDLRLNFTDPLRGVSAEIFQEGPGNRPGWQTFRMVLRGE